MCPCERTQSAYLCECWQNTLVSLRFPCDMQTQTINGRFKMVGKKHVCQQGQTVGATAHVHTTCDETNQFSLSCVPRLDGRVRTNVLLLPVWLPQLPNQHIIKQLQALVSIQQLLHFTEWLSKWFTLWLSLPSKLAKGVWGSGGAILLPSQCAASCGKILGKLVDYLCSSTRESIPKSQDPHLKLKVVLVF